MSTTIEREQAQTVYEYIRTDLVLMGLENNEDVAVSGWNDLHEYADPNQYLIHALGEDAFEAAVISDDFSAFDHVMSLLDVLFSSNPIRFCAA